MRNYSTLFLFIVSVCFYTSCKDNNTPISFTYTLIPGIGLDELNLGESGNRVIEVFGEATIKTNQDGSTYTHYLEYFSEGLWFYFTPSESNEVNLSLPITQIIASGKYAGNTDQGVIIGSSREQVNFFHGEPNFFDEVLNQDQYPGINFCYDIESFVTSIKVQ